MQVERTRHKKKTTRKKYRFIKGQNSPAPRKRKKKAATLAPARKSISKTKKVKSGVRKTTGRTKAAGPKAVRAKAPIIFDAPGWDDLKSAENDRVRNNSQESQRLSALSTVRFSLGILAVAALFTLYVGHVQATKSLLNDVYQVRKENFSLNLRYNQLQGEYDTATGPAVIYRRAAALGLQEQKQVSSPIYLRGKKR